jgi:predicted HAD superfamily Cof-like phosphohydrolase
MVVNHKDPLYYPDMYGDVGDFHRKFGLTNFGDSGGPPALLDQSKTDGVSVLDFRVNFMQEEIDEFVMAHLEGDLAKAADALVDLVYVALGTAHMMRVPFDECWDAVQEANMKKVRASGHDDPLSVRKHKLDVVKPPGWTPPNIGEIIGEIISRYAK